MKGVDLRVYMAWLLWVVLGGSHCESIAANHC